MEQTESKDKILKENYQYFQITNIKISHKFEKSNFLFIIIFFSQQSDNSESTNVIQSNHRIERLLQKNILALYTFFFILLQMFNSIELKKSIFFLFSS